MKGKITIQHGSIVNATVDSIIIPGNSTGAMPGGIGLAIKTVGGQELEEEAIHRAPIIVGEAIITPGGTLRCKHIIHACISEYPDGKSDEHIIATALANALTLARDSGAQTIAICGLKTETVPIHIVAETMVDTISSFVSHFSEIILIDTEEDMISAWKSKHHSR
jgi:O-acetyl-ADP-ribose deacetylase (regulator of RNase III)